MANKKLAAIITIGGAVASSLGAAFGSVRREADSLGQAITRLKDRQRQLNAELAKVGRDGNNAASLRVQYARQELDLIGKQIAALRKRDAIEKSRQENRDRRSELSGKIGATMATGAAIGATLGVALKESADFGYNLQLIGNTANMSRAEVVGLGKEIMRVSRETGQSATDVQRAMGFLIAAGMDTKTAAQLLVPIGKSATAAGADVEDLSRMVFTLNDSLKIAPDGMQKAIDAMAQAGKEGNVELRDMAKQLPVLGAGFLSLKMQGTEAAATMGAALQIARKGAADADEAANNMKNFIAKIMSPETLKKAQKSFGIDLYKIITDAQKGGRNPFDAAMEAVIKATKGDQKKIGELFQDMQVQNFIRPMIQNWEEYQRIKNKALGAEGVTDRDFALMMDTTKVKLEQLGNAFGRFGIAVGDAIAGMGGEGGMTLAQRLDQATEFVNANKELVGTAVQVVGGLFAMRLATLGAMWTWTAAKGVWLGVQAAWAAAPAVIGGVTTALGLLRTGLLAIGAAAAANPIGLLVTAVVGLGAALVLVIGYWDELRAKINSFSLPKPLKDFMAFAASPGRYLWDETKAMFSPGGKNAQANPDQGVPQFDAMGGAAGVSLPPVPAPAKKGGVTVTDNSTHTYHITQQPGQDSKSFAEDIERRRQQQAGVRARSSLLDGVGAQ